MNPIHLRIRVQTASLADASHASIIAGRLLISLIAILLPAMLWTERITTWDRFFQGGQDCETGILALFAFLALVILLSQRGKQSTALQFALRRSLSWLGQNLRGSAAFSFRAIFAMADFAPASSSSPGLQALPLRI